jgi:hypothetical protein
MVTELIAYRSDDRGAMIRTIGVIATVALLVGCAPAALTREQEYGYRAIEDCAKTGNQRNWSYWVLPNGSIRFEGRADGFSPVRECLKSRYGYKF